MIGLLLIALAILLAWFSVRRFHKQAKEDVTSPKASARLERLWQYVGEAWSAKRYLAAERALLSILRIDHKNTAAYNRLGMLYARQQNFEDAIECFDIASSLTPTISTLYNLGLVNYEFGNFDKAAAAFEKVIDLEPNIKRYMVYAKALEKIGEYKKVVDIIEKVAQADPTQAHLEMLAQAHEHTKHYDKAEDVRRQAAQLRASNSSQ